MGWHGQLCCYVIVLVHWQGLLTVKYKIVLTKILSVTKAVHAQIMALSGLTGVCDG